MNKLQKRFLCCVVSFVLFWGGGMNKFAKKRCGT